MITLDKERLIPMIRPVVVIGAASVAVLLAACSASVPATSNVTASTSAQASASRSQPGGVQTVAYAQESPTQTMQLYLPVGADGDVPVVVLIHGGAFEMGDSTMESDYAEELVANGFAVAAINYRLSGEAAYPAGAQDVKAAVRYLRANADEYGINPGQIAAWGQSAGGYLANLLGATGDQQTIFDDPSSATARQSSAVQAVVSWFGPSDFATMDEQAADVAACEGMAQVHGSADSPESRWLGEAVDTSDQTASTNLSSYVAAAEVLPAWYLAHGDADCLVPPGQSQQIKHALDAAGASSTYVVLEGAGHMDPAFDATQLEPTIAFLKRAFGMS